ncbi:MAG: hypothetical protein HGA44_15220 [Cellulomonadaceae bacterium]|nr:hypothetical protein [Cellulomonadaceae bacterium]
MGTVLAATAALPPPAFNTWAWWSIFLVSPAVAGFAALGAAVFAWRGVQSRIREDRAAAALVRSNELEDRGFDGWWDRFQWTADRLGTLDPLAAVHLLKALADDAPDDVALALVAAASARYRDEDDDEEAPDA